jgi:spermidine synthase
MVNLGVIISFCAMSVLCLEVAWMRLFAIESFSSFGYMILSIALLGFGLGGVAITLFADRFAGRREAWLFRFSVLFPVVGTFSMITSRLIPFVPQNVVQDSTQWLYIGLYYVLLSLPFLVGSLIIGLILTTAGRMVGRLYFADLVGSGLGGLVVLFGFYLLAPQYLPVLVVILFLPALAAAAWGADTPGTVTGRHGRGVRLAVAALVAAGCVTVLISRAELHFSEYKGISYTLASSDVTEAKVVDEAQGPLGLIQVVESKAERTAPGLSTAAPMSAMPPVQKGLYIDGSKVASVTRVLTPAESSFQDWLLTSVPYRLREKARVFQVGLGGGEGIAQALHFGASQVRVAEINGVQVELLRGRFGTENGGMLDRPEVQVEVTDGRELAGRHAGAFDLVFVNFLDASGLSFPGSKSHSENYLFTVEAMERFAGALANDGILVVSTRVENPPRGSLRILPTVADAVRNLWGQDALARSLAYVRGEFHGMLLVRKGGFDDAEIDALLADAFDHGFAVAYYPGMGRDVLEQKAREEDAFWEQLKEEQGVDLSDFENGKEAQDPFYDCLAALATGVEPAQEYMAAYPFDIRPTTDNRPYFSAMLKSGSFDFIRQGAYNPTHWEREVPPDLWAEPVVAVTLVQALLFASLILLLPLLARKGRERAGGGGGWRSLVYFSCLAVGFMFAEMVLIQKFTLFVAAPAYAAAVVLSGMLVFSGIGAAFSSRFSGRLHVGIRVAVGGIVVACLAYSFGLTPLLTATMSLPEWGRIALSLLAVGPLAFCLGMPFPLGLAALSGPGREGEVAWGWAVNGAVSVVGVVLAQTVAMLAGFAVVFFAAAGIYLLALAMFPLAHRAAAGN